MKKDKWMLLSVVAIALAAPSAEAQTSSAPCAVTPHGPTNFGCMAWNDEFNGTALDSTKWNPTAAWNNAGYAAQNVSVSGGALHLKDTLSGSSYTRASVISGKVFGTNNPDPFTFKYGIVEIQARVPTTVQNGASQPAVGMWPALWFMPSDNRISGDGEIDLLEEVHDPIVTFNSTYHFDSSTQMGRACNPANPTDWNIFTVEWSPGHVNFYTNGSLCLAINDSTVTSAPHYMILSQQITGPDGSWGTAPDATTKTALSNGGLNFDIDWVRYFPIPGASSIVSDQAGSSSTTPVTTGAADTTPPSVPGGLSATAVSSSQVRLSWSASTDNIGVAGYRIYRDGAQVATASLNSYTDNGLSANTAYSYTVSAYDAAGNSSAQSAMVTATTQNSPSGGATNGPFVGQYYASTATRHYAKLIFTRTDPAINFNWNNASPDPRLPTTDYAVHWTGTITFPTSGTYNFTAVTDDGMRIWIDGVNVLNRWFDQSASYTFRQSMIAGTHTIRVDYYQHFGGALAQVYWTLAQTAGATTGRSNVDLAGAFLGLEPRRARER